MSSFRDRIISALVGPLEPSHHGPVKAFVTGSLADLPHHLRLGIMADSILLESLARVRHGGRIPDDATLRTLVIDWESSPFTPIRQYARLVSSLVLFAEQEAIDPGHLEATR